MGNTHDELVQRLRALQVSSLCDADKTLPVLDPQIRPVVRAARFVGAAFTVIAEDDHLAVLAAVGQAEPGSVLVIATRGGTRAVAGELFTSEASRRGLAGIVIDGFCRDLTGLRAIGLPVFARGVTPMSGTMRVPPQVAIPITCGGVRVQPGDLVVADDDGVVIASADRLRDAVADAERIELGERGSWRVWRKARAWPSSPTPRNTCSGSPLVSRAASRSATRVAQALDPPMTGCSVTRSEIRPRA